MGLGAKHALEAKICQQADVSIGLRGDHRLTERTADGEIGSYDDSAVSHYCP
jgi:hypothetical protein